MPTSDGSINEAPGSGSDRSELIQELNRNYDLALAERLSATELETLLAGKLNELIRIDFNALVTILYRIDVNETKLKELLRTSAGEDAGRIMARLIIERQEQKIKTRNASGATGTGPVWKDL
jgi:hypothetical protein